MAAKEILGNSGRGAGTKVAEYSEQGPFHCEDCVFLKTRGVPDEEHGLCREKHVLKDPQVKTDPKTRLKIVNLEIGCCRYVKYPQGYVEGKQE